MLFVLNAVGYESVYIIDFAAAVAKISRERSYHFWRSLQGHSVLRARPSLRHVDELYPYGYQAVMSLFMITMEKLDFPMDKPFKQLAL